VDTIYAIGEVSRGLCDRDRYAPHAIRLSDFNGSAFQYLAKAAWNIGWVLKENLNKEQILPKQTPQCFAAPVLLAEAQ
jgi:hypothetical protein